MDNNSSNNVFDKLEVMKPLTKTKIKISDIPQLKVDIHDMESFQITEEIGGFRLAMIPLNLLKQNPIQPGERTTMKNLKGLNDSINIYGLLGPILIAENNKRFYLIDGARRSACYYVNGTPSIPGVIRKSTKAQILAHFIECNDPKNTKIIKKKDYLSMYLKRSDAPLPKTVTRDLVFIVDQFGKDYIKFMVDNKMATGTIRTCINVGKDIGLTTEKKLKDFIQWAIETKSIYFIKTFARIKKDETSPGNSAKILLDSFDKWEQISINIG